MEAKVYQENMRLGDDELTPMWCVSIDGKKKPNVFYKESHAYIYAGLLLQGLSINDCSYLSNYITVMIEGLNFEQHN